LQITEGSSSRDRSNETGGLMAQRKRSKPPLEKRKKPGLEPRSGLCLLAGPSACAGRQEVKVPSEYGDRDDAVHERKADPRRKTIDVALRQLGKRHAAYGLRPR
jgi:hypothetical protein